MPGWAILARRLGAALMIVALLPGAARGGEVEVRLEGARSAKGLLRVCLTRDPALFLKCNLDPAAYKQSIPAAASAKVTFADVAPGDYALVVLHDENGNGKADRMLGIPREGVGFSNNPVIRTGPPKFAAARFHVGEAAVKETIRLKYFL
jgi:uncharacterized protein (DUF2141 family)